MRHIFILSLLILFQGIIGLTFGQSIENKIVGEWLTTDKDAIVKMYYGNKKGQSEDKIYGQLIWLEEPNNEDGSPKKDKENPKENLRKRTILGLTIIKDLEWDGDEDEWLWEDGSAYDPESGNTYSFKAYIDPDEPDILNCRGYLGFSLLGRTEVWTRKK
ncbi:MAG: DUF2147 domain-containing protein [Cytophagales bacterium]